MISYNHRTTEEDLRKFHHLQKQISACRACQDQFGFAPHPILFGNLNAKIMQISQVPSLRVHQTGKPFYDASGKRLRSARKGTFVLPHPSPLNIKWFRGHPAFEEERMKTVSEIIHEVLG